MVWDRRLLSPAACRGIFSSRHHSKRGAHVSREAPVEPLVTASLTVLPLRIDFLG